MSTVPRKHEIAPYQSIAKTVKVTGLSEYALRKGVKEGSIPHLCFGIKYLINVPALLEKLDAESKAAIKVDKSQ